MEDMMTGTILVVDDDMSHSCILEQLLTRAGHAVVLAADGKQALDLYKQKTFDLIITDVFMPVMGGIELIEAVKKINSDAQFLVITACPVTASENYAQRALDAGAHQVFSKPYNWQELLNATHFLIDARKKKEDDKKGHGELSILVVDDNEAIQDSFKSIFDKNASSERLNKLFDDVLDDNSSIQKDRSLADIETSLEFASQGHEAIEKYKSRYKTGSPFDFVFMDVRMPPGIDGIEAACEIKKTNPEARIIICSAYSDYSWDEVVEKVGNTEGLSYLHKPFSAEMIKTLLEENRYS